MATTTTRKKTYNPYDDVKAISEYKGKYADAKSTGGDYKQWQQKAAENYMNLHANGRADLADQLAASNYEQSLEILKGYQPTTLYDDYYAKVYGDSVEEASSPKLSEGAQKIFDAYYGANGILNDKTITKDENGNVVSGLNVDHYNTGRNQLDFINGFDVTKQPYYEGIMQQYNLLGGDAAQGALAGGASGNSGNIDSYAQANANRQQLAFTTAGINAALAAANQNQANWQNVYDRMTAHLGTMGEQNNDMLGRANEIYATDSAERQNLVNANADLAKQEMVNKINKYLADIGYDTDIYGIDSAERQNQVNADAGLTQAQIQANAGLSEAQIRANAEKYGYDVDKQIADAELKAAGDKWLAEQQIANGIDPFTGKKATNSSDTEADVFRFISEASKLIGSDESVQSYTDVYNMALERFPEYDKDKIMSYVKSVKALNGSGSSSKT